MFAIFLMVCIKSYISGISLEVQHYVFQYFYTLNFFQNQTDVTEYFKNISLLPSNCPYFNSTVNVTHNQ
jgi:hypothetical protein